MIIVVDVVVEMLKCLMGRGFVVSCAIFLPLPLPSTLLTFIWVGDTLMIGGVLPRRKGRIYDLLTTRLDDTAECWLTTCVEL